MKTVITICFLISFAFGIVGILLSKFDWAAAEFLFGMALIQGWKFIND